MATLAGRHDVTTQAVDALACAFYNTCRVFEPSSSRNTWSKSHVEQLAAGTADLCSGDLPLTNSTLLAKTLLAETIAGAKPRSVGCEAVVEHMLAWNASTFFDKAERAVAAMGYRGDASVDEEALMKLMRSLLVGCGHEELTERESEAVLEDAIHSIVLECKVYDLLTIGKHRDPLGKDPTMRANEVVRWFHRSGVIDRFNVTTQSLDFGVVVGSAEAAASAPDPGSSASPIPTIKVGREASRKLSDVFEDVNKRGPQASQEDADTVDGGGHDCSPRHHRGSRGRNRIRRKDTHESNGTATTGLIKAARMEILSGAPSTASGLGAAASRVIRGLRAMARGMGPRAIRCVAIGAAEGLVH
eukprot:CAMPEP_0206315528 /NCGR_PEP_ID=MMETSP0106_2-20121207/15611_1 /ASSEMBLY_ACC=CAM_ASM_000206 /TAXON_ID=81532 /ORGANISM="Acanthoeca-like sp., Strain 10tr" /LENGTH=358 /DNA_ID=CAMNT_0053746981 /DNA_START=272 /DNA_END=1349 /DNA_ORIENTATION=+